MLWRGEEKIIPDIRQRTEVELVEGLSHCYILFMTKSGMPELQGTASDTDLVLSQQCA